MIYLGPLNHRISSSRELDKKVDDKGRQLDSFRLRKKRSVKEEPLAIRLSNPIIHAPFHRFENWMQVMTRLVNERLWSVAKGQQLFFEFSFSAFDASFGRFFSGPFSRSKDRTCQLRVVKTRARISLFACRWNSIPTCFGLCEDVHGH
jgi:hypothetical protein